MTPDDPVLPVYLVGAALVLLVGFWRAAGIPADEREWTVTDGEHRPESRRDTVAGMTVVLAIIWPALATVAGMVACVAAPAYALYAAICWLRERLGL
jgi:hypothetical protein